MMPMMLRLACDVMRLKCRVDAKGAERENCRATWKLGGKSKPAQQRGEKRAVCPRLREQASKAAGAAQKRGNQNKRGANGEGGPLLSWRDAELLLSGTKSREGSDKLSDLSTGGDEFRIISRE